MTNRQWLEGLDDEEFFTTLQRFLNAYDPSDDECPPDRNWFCNSNCTECWVKWLRSECDKPTTSIYDIVEEHKNCTVQVLKNSVTGEISVGWKEVKEMKRNEGEWLKNVRGDHCIVCSECGYGLPTEGFAWTDCNRESDERETAVLITDVKSYCPSCGAKMRNA